MICSIFADKNAIIYTQTMNTLLVILLIAAGIVLLLLEMFLLPGFGIAGITGFGCLAGAVGVAYFCISATAGHITLGAVLLLSALSIYGFVKSKALEKMGLDTAIDSKVSLAAPGKKIENLEKEAEKLSHKQEEKEAEN